MHLFIKSAMAWGLILGAAIVVSGCDNKNEAPAQKTAEQIQAEKIAIEQLTKEREQQEAQIETALRSAKPDQLRSILQSCKSFVLEQAKTQNRSPFAFFLVDEYSADIYQAAAYAEGGRGSISSENDRIKRLPQGSEDERDAS